MNDPGSRDDHPWLQTAEEVSDDLDDRFHLGPVRVDVLTADVGDELLVSVGVSVEHQANLLRLLGIPVFFRTKEYPQLTTLFAAQPLVMMAELAAANGVDLYGTDGRALSRLVARALSGIDDPSSFAGRAGAAQEPVGATAANVAWALPYAQRFHDRSITTLLASAGPLTYVYLGGAPPTVR